MKRARSKYGAVPTTISYKGREIRCASKAEAKRFGELILLERAGKICALQFHPKFHLFAPGQKAVAAYIGDAFYYEGKPGAAGFENTGVVEDIKGVETEVFKLKAKWFRACYPTTDLRIVRARA